MLPAGETIEDFGGPTFQVPPQHSDATIHRADRSKRKGKPTRIPQQASRDSGRRPSSEGPGGPKAPRDGRGGATARDALFDFAQRSRVAQRGRVCQCCRKRVGTQSVQLQRGDDEAVRIVGVETCSSVWACPVCAHRIYARRAAEVTRFVLWALQQGLVLYMVTLTIRHRAPHSLKQLQRGLAACWRRWFTTGRPATERRREWGIQHYVKATEITHGPNGWHPHLHILLAADRTPAELQRIEATNDWIVAVAKLLGDEWRPDYEHGLRITPIKGNEQAKYISKLGLEIAQISTKSSRSDRHKTHWDILRDASRRVPAATRLWEEFAEAMKGQRQLTWSRGTKKAAGVEDIEDDEITEEVERPEVLQIEPSAWDAMIRAGILPILVGLAKRSMPELARWLRGRGWYGWRLLPRKTRAP